MYVKVVKPKNYECWINSCIGKVFEVKPMVGLDKIVYVTSGEYKDYIIGQESYEVVNYKPAQSED